MCLWWGFFCAAGAGTQWVSGDFVIVRGGRLAIARAAGFSRGDFGFSHARRNYRRGCARLAAAPPAGDGVAGDFYYRRYGERRNDWDAGCGGDALFGKTIPSAAAHGGGGIGAGSDGDEPAGSGGDRPEAAEFVGDRFAAQDQGNIAARGNRDHDRAWVDRDRGGRHAPGRVRLHRETVSSGAPAPTAATHGRKGAAGHRESIPA